MDLSALIFVALAAAWAAYLIPKALQYHEADQRSRTVEAFSSSMRVLASREPVDATSTRLVPAGPRRSSSERSERIETRRATVRAARRRRRVLALLMLANVAVGVLAWREFVPVLYVAVPAALLALWLVMCRIGARAERRHRSAEVEGLAQQASRDRSEHDEYRTEEVPVVRAPIVDAPGTWDPVPVTLPTYVAKEAASPRTVRTIDLDSTGVWSSGRIEADAELARQADQAEQTARDTESDGGTDRRVSGA